MIKRRRRKREGREEKEGKKTRNNVREILIFNVLP